MKTIVFLVIFSIIGCSESKKINVDELRCLVCNVSLEELSKAVRKIDPTKRMDIGGYRLDTDGNYKHKSVSQAKSEIHLSELIDDICNKMDDYVRATSKTDGKLTLLKIITEDGKMNSLISEVDIVQDDDLNKSLKYYCEEIMEEFEDNIIKHFQDDVKDIHTRLCVEESSLCKDSHRKEEL